MPRKKNHEIDREAFFPARLRKLMKERKVSQQFLANALGLGSRQAVANYCDGRCSPDWRAVREIADFFDVSAAYLVGQTEVPAKETDLQGAASYLTLSGKATASLRKNASETLDLLLRSSTFYEIVGHLSRAQIEALADTNYLRGEEGNPNHADIRDVELFRAHQKFMRICDALTRVEEN